MFGNFRRRPSMVLVFAALLLFVGLADGAARGGPEEDVAADELGESTTQSEGNDPKPVAALDWSEERDGDIVIAGECQDESGDAVTGAQVFIYRQDTPVSHLDIVSLGVTDDMGRFRFEVPRSDLEGDLDSAKAILLIRSEQHVSYQRWLNPEGINAKLEIPLIRMSQRGTPLKGQVVNEDGRPLAGVWVYFPNVLGQPIPNALSGLTGADGRFEIHDGWYPRSGRATENQPPPDTTRRIVSYTLLAMHPDYPSTASRVSPEAEEVTIQLRVGAKVDGRVVDGVTGNPVAECIVSAQGVDDHGWYQAQTDEDGRYRLVMREDRYNIWAAANDRMPIALDSVKVTNGQDRAVDDIRLVRGGFVVGRVLDADTGKPILKENLKSFPTRVAHYGPARPRSGAAVTSAKVGEDGTYRLHVAPGDNYVYLMSPQLRIVRRSFDPNDNGVIPVPDGEIVELDFFIKVEEPADRFRALLPRK